MATGGRDCDPRVAPDPSSVSGRDSQPAEWGSGAQTRAECPKGPECQPLTRPAALGNAAAGRRCGQPGQAVAWGFSAHCQEGVHLPQVLPDRLTWNRVPSGVMGPWAREASDASALSPGRLGCEGEKLVSLLVFRPNVFSSGFLSVIHPPAHIPNHASSHPLPTLCPPTLLAVLPVLHSCIHQGHATCQACFGCWKPDSSCPQGVYSLSQWVRHCHK